MSQRSAAIPHNEIWGTNPKARESEGSFDGELVLNLVTV